MKKNMKKILVCLLCVGLIAGLLAGCGASRQKNRHRLPPVKSSPMTGRLLLPPKL